MTTKTKKTTKRKTTAGTRYGSVGKKRKFLKSLAESGHVTDSARAARVSRTTVFVWRRDDEQFAADYAQAIGESEIVLESEATRRAVEGVDEPIYQSGMLVGYKRRYSDLLLIFLLKATNPQKYRDNATGDEEDPIHVKITREIVKGET